MTKNIEVMSYDPNWIKLFEIEAEKIKQALSSELTAIHHIGSTSVPGLAAKPKIDIIVAVEKPAKIIKNLENIGLEYRGEYNIPMRWSFVRRDNVNANIHVFSKDHPEIELNILFRDYLRTHDDTRDEYAKLKYKILKDESAHNVSDSKLRNYTLRKGDFIRNILTETGFDKLRILKASDEIEQEAIKQYRNDISYIINDNDIALYQGVNIIGYAEVSDKIDQIVLNEDKKILGNKFIKIIENWLKEKE